MKKALLVVNPISGKQVAKDSFFDIVLSLSKKYELTVHITKSASDLVETAKNCVYPTLIVCGGDGTLSGAVQGLLENPHREQIKIGYLPCGTANDVAHTLGIPKDITDAADYVCKNKAHPHDIGMLVLLTYPACDEWNLPLFCPHCQARICEVAKALLNCGMTLYE